MAEDGGILSEEMKAAAVLVINQAQDALMIWAARDPNPDAGGTHPTYALAEVEGEALASALVLSAVAFASGATMAEHMAADGKTVGANFCTEFVVAPMAEVVELLLTETVARLTGGGGPGA